MQYRVCSLADIPRVLCPLGEGSPIKRERSERALCCNNATIKEGRMYDVVSQGRDRTSLRFCNVAPTHG